MAELPTFYVQPAPDNPDHALVLCGIKHEWEHVEDHDAALRMLDPVAQSIVGEMMNERTFERLEARIREFLYRTLQTGQIYRGWDEDRWVLADNAKLRNEARKREFESRWPGAKLKG